MGTQAAAKRLVHVYRSPSGSMDIVAGDSMPGVAAPIVVDLQVASPTKQVVAPFASYNGMRLKLQIARPVAVARTVSIAVLGSIDGGDSYAPVMYAKTPTVLPLALEPLVYSWATGAVDATVSATFDVDVAAMTNARFLVWQDTAAATELLTLQAMAHVI